MNNEKPIGLVIDNGADLPKEFIENNQIEVIHHQIFFPGENPNPVVPENFCRTLRELKEKKIFPKTSFASLSSYVKAYQQALEKFEKILVIIVSSGLSGAFNAALQAKAMISEEDRIEILDSFSVTVAEGLLVMKAQGLIDRNEKMPEIIKFLEEFKHKIKLLGFLEDFSWIKAGGRVSGKLAGIIELLQKRGIRPALGLKEGKIGLAGIRFSAKDRVEAIARELGKEKRKMRLAIGHADAPAEAQRLKSEFEKIGKEVLYVSEITPVLTVHSGPGALIVSYYLE